MTDTRNQSRGRGALRIVILAAVVVAVFAARFIAIGRGETPEGIETVQAREGIPVEAARVVHADLESWTTLAGTVEGIVQYPIVSNNALRVIDLVVDEGDAVRAGDVVIRLAREAPTPMVHSYQKSRASYENALKDARRLRNLFAEGAVSEQSLDQAETQLKVAEADLHDAEGSTTLVASRDGVVTSILVREGETVGAGKALAWIARTDTVKVCFEAGSRQALALRTGQAARWTAGGSGPAGEGAVSKLDLMADPRTHLLEGEALFANPDGRLVPGMLVSIEVRTLDVPAALVVPSGCLLDEGDGHGLFTVRNVDGELRAVRRSVRLGGRTTDLVEILDGVETGDLAVRFGQSRIEDGALVRLIDDRGEG